MRTILRNSLRWRLTLWYTATLGALLAALAAVAFFLLDRGLRANVDVSLVSIARSAAAATAEAQRRGAWDRAIEDLMGPLTAERFFRFLDPLGQPDPRLAPQRQKELPLSSLALRNAAAGRDTFETVELPGRPDGPLRMLTSPVLERGRLANLVQVALPLAGVESATRQFLLVLAALGPFALLGVAVGGWLLAGRALATVDAMVEAARRITAKDMSLRLEGGHHEDELGRLANVLNDMLERIERSLRAARDFSADAAHELRTPLTILRGEIDVALRSAGGDGDSRRVLGSCREEVERLSNLVEDLLLLARADAGVEERTRDIVDLAQVVADARPALASLAATSSVRLDVEPTEPARVQGNAPMLFRVVFNLCENAIRHAGDGKRVAVRLSRAGGRVRLEVEDHGPGIPASEQARLFDRFYRADPARTRGGTGLGLALVRSIVELHRGRVTVESAPGSGATFRVELPEAAGTAVTPT